jgi:hypothetical protein
MGCAQVLVLIGRATHLIRFATLLSVAMFCAVASFAQAADLLIAPKLSTSVQGNGLPASCMEWTDGCRICARKADGSAACSNPSIACLLEKPRCTRP